MNKKQRKTLEKIYQAAADIKWSEFVSLIKIWVAKSKRALDHVVESGSTNVQ